MQVEIVLTTIDGAEKVVAEGSLALTGTSPERFLTWHATHLFTSNFTLLEDQNVYGGWIAVDANGDMLTLR